MRKTRCARSDECSRGDGSAHGASKTILRRHAWCGAGILFFSAGFTAQAQDFIPTPQCTTSGQTVTCEGDLSYLELSENNYTTLRVENLTQDLAPPAGTGGITFHSSNDDINLDINTGENSIRTSGSASEGIDASSGGNVTVDVTGHITTTGNDSQGIEAYTDGAGEVMVTVTGDITTEGNESGGIDARSEDENDPSGGGAVTVTVVGDITTKGLEDSEGIYARSAGDAKVTVNVTGDITTEGGCNDMGGCSEGILAESDGAVEVTVAGHIKTTGENSQGIEVDSNGVGDVTVDVTGDVATEGEDSEGIFAQSENGALKVTVKSADITNGAITTEGESSEGIFAQSEGNAPVTIDVTGNIRTKGTDSEGIDVESRGTGVVGVTVTGDVTTAGEDSKGVDAQSRGGAVTVTVTGDITTEGIEDSEGIYARSRDDAAVTIDVTGNIRTKGTDSEGIDVESSNTGPVTVTMTGDIITESDETDNTRNHGIHALSRGGAVVVAVRGNIWNKGTNSTGIDVEGRDAGAVTVTMTGDITTEGESNEGIAARSDDGPVTVTVAGNINAKGPGSDGIDVRSDGDIDITLKGGTEGSTIASTEARGVEFRGGATNTLTIHDAVTISGASFDVRGSGGNETINNYGTLTALGNIDLGDGVNAFNNREGATFHSGSLVDLGAGNTFTNWGKLSPGGAHAVQHTTLIGNFVNQPEGILIVTIDPETESSDKLSVAGTATLQGSMLRVTGITYADDRTYTILEATDGVADRFADVIDTLFIDNRLSYDADSVMLSPISKGDKFDDFAETANQRAAARSLDHLSITDDLPQAVLALTTKQDAQAAYEALAGEVHASLNGALLDTGQRPVAAITRHLTAGAGWWMTGYGTWGDTDATSNTAQMDTELGGVLLGFDHSLDEHWRLGILGGYSHTRVTQRARASAGSADTWLVGLYGGAETRALNLRFGTIYNGHYSLEANRAVRFTGFSERLSASYSAWSWQVFAEAGHPMQVRNLRLEPFTSVSSIHLKTEGFNETGGTAALTASSKTHRRTFTTLGVRGALELTDRLQARGLVGWRHAFDDIDPSSTSRLAGGPAFTIEGAPTARDAAVAEFGFEDRLSDQAVLNLAYHGRYGDGVDDYGVNAGLTVTF